MPSRQIRRPVVRMDMRPQIPLFDDLAEPAAPPPIVSDPAEKRFVEHDPRELFIGGVRLHEHLEHTGVTDVFAMRDVLEGLDWSVFEASYPGVGRAAYAPRAMVGIVLYGALRGMSSLRDLERLARTDLGCMWLSGCIQPDHSILGRFMQRHAGELSTELFKAIVEEALRRTHSNRGALAGDGTTLEAVSSRFALLKREAARAWCEAHRDDEDDALREQAKRVGQALAERPRAGQIVVSEPDAALLQLKNGRGLRPGYEAAVTANEARVVVDAELDTSSELAAMTRIVDRLDETQTRELMLDAGFSQGFDLIERTVEKEISLLSPLQGQKRGGEGEPEQRIALHEFHYDEAGDFYTCPEGERLYPRSRFKGSAPQAVTHRRPHTRYVRRQAMVEPVFAYLRGVQRFERFRRRGLEGARLEFRLQICAYNLSRIVAYARRAARKAFFALIWALWSPWRALRGLVQAVWRQIVALHDQMARAASEALASPQIAG